MSETNRPAIGPLLNQLADASRSVDQRDLSGLAKMHGCCEALLEALGGAVTSTSAAGAETCKGIARALEALILGETPDADECLRRMQEDVAGLTEELGAAGANEPGTAAMGSAPYVPQGSDAPAASTSERLAPATTEPAYISEPLRIDPNEVEFVRGFVEEAKEHLAGIETAILEVEQDATNAERINGLFRPFHTIKGMAGFLNLRDINRLTHEAETLLDQGRKGQRAVTPALIDLILEVVDILKVQISEVDAFVAKPHDGVVPQPPVAEMIERLRAVVTGAEPAAECRASGDGAVSPGAGMSSGAKAAAAREQAATQPECATPAGGGPRASGVSAAAKCDAATPSPDEPAPTPTAAARGEGVIASAKAPAASVDRSIRIDTTKLDMLVDMVGELVIAQTLVSGNPELNSGLRISRDIGHVTKIVREVQQVAMSMRMVPIGPTFQRMARLVRDLSRKISKKVELKISGEETELDKTVIEQIGDPLVHMVRNAVDHGIETREERVAAGKPASGTVWLRASHQGGNIVVEIEDDGKGLDAAALIAKGREKGLVGPDDALSEQQAYQLVFAAGFSMAKVVTDVSGRGVGMDVVRRNIEQLRGSVEISSKKGAGTRFAIRLPLTLAIIDGMVVKAGGERFIIPTITIEQSLRPKPEQISTVQRRGQVLNVRGRLIPLVQLGPLFKLGEPVNPSEAMVVISSADGEPVGLVVDELIGQQQVVIKSLGERFKKLRGIVGGAILGDGRVGLILEISGLVAAHHDHRESDARRAAQIDAEFRAAMESSTEAVAV